jgi:hypothetical protein
MLVWVAQVAGVEQVLSVGHIQVALQVAAGTAFLHL